MTFAVSLDSVLSQLVAFGTDWGIKIVGVLFGLMVAFWIAGRVRDKIQANLEKRNFDATLSRFFANMARYGLLTGAILGLLGVFGIQTASFAAVIAAAGLAVGLAFQGTLSNFAAGVMLLVFRPFKVADVIKVAGQIGVVEAIALFTIELKTADNRKIIVPNSQVFGSTIDNYTFYPIRRVDVPVGIDYGVDIDRTREVLDKAAKSVEGVLAEPVHQIYIHQLGASSVDWQIRVWCNTPDYWTVYQAVIRAAKIELGAADIGIPFPQMDVHFDAPPSAATAGMPR